MTAPVQPSLQVDPAALTKACRDGLAVIHDQQPARGRGGYGHRLRGFVTLKTVDRLQRMGLVRMDISTRGNRLMLTGSGLNTYFVMEQRRARRAGH